LWQLKQLITQENKINYKVNLLVHSCWCIVSFVLGLNSNLFEIK
jgi:hypothetical protein